MVVRKLGLFAELCEAVGIDHAEKLDRSGLVEGPIVQRGETADLLAAYLGNQVQRAGRIGRGFQHGAQADTGHVLRQQQIAFQRDRIDRLLLGEAVEKAQHLGAGRADVAVQLDARYAALGDHEAQPAVGIQVGRDGGEHVAVGAIALQNRLSRRIDLWQRHRRSDQASGKLGDLRLRIRRDALDLDAADAYRTVRNFRAWRRRRWDDRSGRDGGR